MNKMDMKYKDFLTKIAIDPDEELDKLESDVGDYLVLKCFDIDYNPNEEGLICEEILDHIDEFNNSDSQAEEYKKYGVKSNA